MTRAIFKSWFVDFDPVLDNALAAGNPIPEEFRDRAAQRAEAAQSAASQGRPFGLPKSLATQFPNAFHDSDLGPIPKGWELSSIGQHFCLTMGQSPPGSTYNEVGEGLPFYQGRSDFGFRFPTRRVYCTSPTRFAEPNDTLVSVRAPVGDVNMASERCVIGRGVAAMRHNSGSRSFTYYSVHHLREYFDRFEAEGTVFGSINKNDFQGLPFIAPTADIASNFERFAGPLDDRIQTCARQSTALAALRDTLLPKLLSGELRVRDAEKFVEAGV
jgi:type I restriction enzyme S subunit